MALTLPPSTSQKVLNEWKKYYTVVTRYGPIPKQRINLAGAGAPGINADFDGWWDEKGGAHINAVAAPGSTVSYSWTSPGGTTVYVGGTAAIDFQVNVQGQQILQAAYIPPDQFPADTLPPVAPPVEPVAPQGPRSSTSGGPGSTITVPSTPSIPVYGSSEPLDARGGGSSIPGPGDVTIYRPSVSVSGVDVGLPDETSYPSDVDTTPDDYLASLVSTLKSKQSVPGSYDPSIVGVQGDQAPYAGDEDWQETNEEGKGTVISQIDYAAVVGGATIGKKVVSAVVKHVLGKGDSDDFQYELDDLKYKWETDQITREEYGEATIDLFKRAKDAEVFDYGKWLDMFLDEFRHLNQLGLDVLAIAGANGLGDVLDSYVSTSSDSDIEEFLTPETVSKIRASTKLQQSSKEPSTIHVLAKYKFNPKTGKNEATSSKKKEEPKPSTVSTPIVQPVAVSSPAVVDQDQTQAQKEFAAILKMKNEEALKNQGAMPSASPSSGDTSEPDEPEEPTVTATPSPEASEPIQAATPAEQKAETEEAFLAWLNQEHPEGINNAWNRQLVKYYPTLAMSVYLGETTYDNAVGYLNSYNAVVTGSIEPSFIQSLLTSVYGFKEVEQIAWVDCTEQQKRLKLAQIFAWGVNNDISEEVYVRDMLGLLKGQTPPDEAQRLYQYMDSGDFKLDCETYAVSDPINSIWRGITSEKGSRALGIFAAGSLTVGGFLTAGPGGAIAGAGAGNFAIMEVSNYTGMNVYRDKAALENKGMYPPTVDSNHGFARNEIVKRFNDLSINQKDMTVEEIDSDKRDIKSLVDQEYRNLERDKKLLMIAGTYFDHKLKLDEFASKLGDYTPKITTINKVTGRVQQVSTKAAMTTGAWSKGVGLALYAPPKYTYRLGSTGQEINSGFFDVFAPGEDVVEVWDGDRLIMSKPLKLYDSEINSQVTFSQAEIDAKLSYLDGKSRLYSTWVVYVPPGYTTTVGKQVIPPQPYEQKIYMNGPDKDVVYWKITGPGVDPESGTIYFSGDDYHEIVPIFEASFEASKGKPQSGSTVFTGLPENAEVYIDGNKVRTEGLVGYHSQPGRDETIVVEVRVPGYEPTIQRVYLSSGKVSVTSLTPIKKVYEERSGGGGGGGGGGGSAPAPTATELVFGQTFAGAKIWLDAVEVVPTLGVGYATIAGYHVVKAEKKGFEIFEKSVYVSSGETINIEASYVALKTPSTTVIPPTPGTPSSTDIPPVGMAYVMFGPSVMGSVIYMNQSVVSVVPGTKYVFPYGYYGILIQTPGKVDWIKNVYLASGDTLTVSPIFETQTPKPSTPGITSTSTMKRVYVNTTLDGAKIMINNGFTGQWTPGYVDLEPGYYDLSITKTGYKTKSTKLYVGDVVAFGQAAIDMAKMKGLIA